jgi:hypothetical protein
MVHKAEYVPVEWIIWLTGNYFDAFSR